ncbi:glycosyltransferase family protein [Chthonobacter rhizosphaerae]|uniref:glycosyltransferase family protein n=1 Tax=Chthonobacter rhizosphaerae TaxID=2735553 RepID=UPI0015EEC88D
MKLVVFGLSISSSWGNGHATLWRGLVKALARRGWQVVFFEKDVSWYRGARDYHAVPNGELVLYERFEDVRALARRHLADADVGMVTSFCPDGLAAGEMVAGMGRGRRVFYDLDTPVTLAKLDAGESLAWIGPEGLAGYDLALSYTGGPALDALTARLKAPAAAPLYGHVDPDVHRPADPDPVFAGDLSYIGTYADDRQAALQALFVDAARARPDGRFVIAGAQYPDDFPWGDNIFFVRHLPPDAHPAFYASSRLTLNITREAMARSGWCPSGRLFEAAACGAVLLSDTWPGLDQFFEPGREILIARTTDDTLAALDLSAAERARIAEAARARVLAEHTSDHRAATLESILARMADRPALAAGEPVS